MHKKESSDQPTLFDWLKQVEELSRQTSTPSLGSLDIDTELRHAISQDLKKAAVPCTGRELSRYDVAARMSELVGHEITKSQLDNWTAEAHDKHRFPAQYLPAFVIATGGQRRAFEVLSKKAGLFALPGPDALRSEIQRLDEEEKRIKAEKHKRKIFLHEIENGR
ncbi:MAG: hypothetical protein HZA15_15610 [Nitrospirae bacterium]|nr:hypothetical protein [Nitrospirota bacterium]